MASRDSWAKQDRDFDFAYSLQIFGWVPGDCIDAIVRALGGDLVPFKSACFFCPGPRHWELYWGAAHDAARALDDVAFGHVLVLAQDHGADRVALEVQPELTDDALVLELETLPGSRSRFNEVEFGA